MCLLSNYTVFAHTVDKNEAEASEEGASEEGASEVKNDEAEWTVMLYLCGMDLESDGGMASNNLEMISKTIPNSDVNFLIETGGTKEWHAKDKVGIDIATDKLERWSYNEDGFTLVDEQENASMAKHTTLSDFIQWGG